MANFSRTKETEGRLQVIAGVALITASKLLSWDGKTHHFAWNGDGKFNDLWQSLDPAFGRVILWSTFSTGAEYLFKGFVMARGTDIRAEELQPKLRTPRVVDDQWIDDVCAGSDTLQVDLMPNFQTLRNVTDELLVNSCPGPVNAAAAVTFQRDVKRLVAAKKFLASSIRNRDTHAYIPNVRQDNLPMVDRFFRPAFNSMIGWLPPWVVSGVDITAELKNTPALVAGLPPV